MAVERTFSIVKPDAVARNLIGEIYSRFEKGGLRIVAAKMLRLTEEQAAGFYAEHDGKPFFADLCSYMRSGPVMLQVLEGEDAIATNRRRKWFGGKQVKGMWRMQLSWARVSANAKVGATTLWRGRGGFRPFAIYDE